MQEHMAAIHGRSKRLSCQQPGCKDHATCPKYLQRHVNLVHHGRKRYSCHLCFRRFSLRHHVKRHKSMHERKEGHSVAGCTACQQDLKRETPVSGADASAAGQQQEEQETETNTRLVTLHFGLRSLGIL